MNVKKKRTCWSGNGHIAGHVLGKNYSMVLWFYFSGYPRCKAYPVSSDNSSCSLLYSWLVKWYLLLKCHVNIKGPGTCNYSKKSWRLTLKNDDSWLASGLKSWSEPTVHSCKCAASVSQCTQHMYLLCRRIHWYKTSTVKAATAMPVFNHMWVQAPEWG